MPDELDPANPESTDITERIRARKAALEAEAEQGFPGSTLSEQEREDEQLRRAYRESGRIQHRA